MDSLLVYNNKDYNKGDAIGERRGQTQGGGNDSEIPSRQDSHFIKS